MKRSAFSIFFIGLWIALCRAQFLHETALPAERMVEVKGYYTTQKNPTDFVTLPNATTGRACLDHCGNDPACAFVSYNQATGACQGLSTVADPWIKSDENQSLLGMTTKKFKKEAEVDYNYGDLEVDEALPVWGLIVPNETVCMDVCSIHPLCNTAVFTSNYNPCYLKNLTQWTPVTRLDAVSFVLPR